MSAADYRRAADRLWGINETLRQIQELMPIQRLSILLAIARAGDGISYADLAGATALSSSTVSRHVQELGKASRHGRDGLDLIDFEADFSGNHARKLVVLNGRGQRLMRTLAQQLEDFDAKRSDPPR